MRVGGRDVPPPPPAPEEIRLIEELRRVTAPGVTFLEIAALAESAGISITPILRRSGEPTGFSFRKGCVSVPASSTGINLLPEIPADVPAMREMAARSAALNADVISRQREAIDAAQRVAVGSATRREFRENAEKAGLRFRNDRSTDRMSEHLANLYVEAGDVSARIRPSDGRRLYRLALNAAGS